MINKLILMLLATGCLTLMFIITLDAWIKVGHPFIGFVHVAGTAILIDWVKEQVKNNARNKSA